MKLAKGIWLALLFSLLVGIVMGTLLRRRAEAPERYIGSAPLPLHVSASVAGVLDPRQHEQQVAQAVQVA